MSLENTALKEQQFLVHFNISQNDIVKTIQLASTSIVLASRKHAMGTDWQPYQLEFFLYKIYTFEHNFFM